MEHGKGLLEAIGFGPKLDSPDKLPEPGKLDRIHRKWRQGIVSQGTKQELVISHGVAAKLINVYLKSRFVCGGFADSPKVQALHPPIDRVLLEELARRDFGGKSKFWAQANKCGWSKFDSATYEDVIQGIREALNGSPLWAIEQFWKGHQ